MPSSASLLLYFLLVFGVIVLPGMDMAFIVGSSIAGGRKAGFAAVAGVTVGGLCHMVFAMTGLFALIRLVPAALPLMLAAGAAYVGWLGWCLVRAEGLVLPNSGAAGRGMRTSFAGALGTCLLNPKAYMFMLAVFPQFVHAESGPIWPQAAVLAAITAATQVAVYGSLAAAVAAARQPLSSKPRGGVWLARAVGVLLMLAAVLTVVGTFFEPTW